MRKTQQDEAGYLLHLEAWRKEQEAALRAERGWLSLAGLFWLKEGENRLGGPLKEAGVFLLAKGKVTFRPAGEPPRELKSDGSGAPDFISWGSLTFYVLQRGKRLGIRLYDSESPVRKHFTGQQWYAPDPAFRVVAPFHAYTPPKLLEITNVLGDTQPVPCPGYVTFVLAGTQCRLEAQATPDGLFFNFRDLTSGKTTYPAGRFLETEKPDKGKVILDFNKAVSPPCAFTEFATCPLPPKANYLRVAIPAGEKYTPH